MEHDVVMEVIQRVQILFLEIKHITLWYKDLYSSGKGIGSRDNKPSVLVCQNKDTLGIKKKKKKDTVLSRKSNSLKK